MIGCPYIAGPACGDCDGTCWDPPATASPEPPGPCGGCYLITGALQDCDGTCDGLTVDNLDQRRQAHATTPQEAPR